LGNAKASTIGEVLDVRLALTSYGIGLVNRVDFPKMNMPNRENKSRKMLWLCKKSIDGVV